MTNETEGKENMFLNSKVTIVRKEGLKKQSLKSILKDSNFDTSIMAQHYNTTKNALTKNKQTNQKKQQHQQLIERKKNKTQQRDAFGFIERGKQQQNKEKDEDKHIDHTRKGGILSPIAHYMSMDMSIDDIEVEEEEEEEEEGNNERAVLKEKKQKNNSSTSSDLNSSLTSRSVNEFKNNVQSIRTHHYLNNSLTQRKKGNKHTYTKKTSFENHDEEEKPTADLGLLTKVYAQLDVLSEKNNSLQARNDELENNSAEQEETIAKLKEEQDELSQLCNELRKSLIQDSGNEKTDSRLLKSELNMYRKQVKDLQNRLMLANDDYQSFSEKHRDEQQALTKQLKNYEKQQDDIVYLQGKMQELEATCREQEKTIKQLRAKNDNETTNVQNAQSELMATKKLVNALSSKYESTQKENDSLKNLQQSAEDNSKADKEEIFALRKEVSKLCKEMIVEKQKIAEQNKQVTQLTQENESYERIVKEHQENEQELKRMVVELEQSNEMVGARLDAMKKDMEKVEEETAVEKEQFESKVDSLTDEVIQLQDQQEMQKETISTLRDELENARENNVHLMDENETLQQSLDTTRTDLKNEIERKETLEDQLASEQHRCRDLVDENKQTDNQLLKLETQLQHYDAKSLSLSEENESLKLNVNALEQQVAASKDKAESALAELEQTVKQMQQLQQEKDAFVSKVQRDFELSKEDFENKLEMMKVKCNYYEQLHLLSEDKDVIKADVMKQLRVDVISMTKKYENVLDHLCNLQVSMKERQRTIHGLTEKLRQTEDLLSATHTKQLKKANLTKKQKLLMKYIDEILIECCADGLHPSDMNAKEKSMRIVQSIHREQQKSKNMEKQVDKLRVRVNRLAALSKFERESKLIAEGMDSAEYDCPSLQSNGNDILQLWKHMDSLNELLQRCRQVQNGEVAISQASFSADIEGISQLYHHIVSLLEPQMNSLPQVRAAREDAQMLAKVEQLKATLASAEAKTAQTISEYESKLAQSNTSIDKKNTQFKQLREKYQHLKEHFDETVKTCEQYKEVVAQFTTLHEQQAAEKQMQDDQPAQEVEDISKSPKPMKKKKPTFSQYASNRGKSTSYSKLYRSAKK